MSTELAQGPFDNSMAEAFAARFVAALNDGALCLMASIGHRTGLFDVMSTSPPATSDELAAKAGLNERYVREWLGAMTTARVVHFDPATRRFTLPAEHAAFLTRAAAADNMAVFAQYIGVLGVVEMTSSSVSRAAAACHMRSFHGFMRSWPRTAVSRSFRPSSRTYFRSSRG
jgi:hypothetical protein